MTIKVFKLALLAATAAGALLAADGAKAEFKVQCDPLNKGGSVKCVTLAASDGVITLADGKPSYIFGFADVTGANLSQIQIIGKYGANFSAPALVVDEGDELYLTLINIGFTNRPDLFDPHTVHYHGFPNASVVFDGEPEGSFGTNVGESFTYYYRFQEPGTYMYHCHQEAAEHMQMGMLGNAYVRPRQNKLADGTDLNGFTHRTGYKYVYNDGDGSTRYDVEALLQISGFDPDFHQLSQDVQPLPFALMETGYAMINGRGYPDTVNPNPLATENPLDGVVRASQKTSAYVEAAQGQKLLLRVSNLDIQKFYTVATTGLPMRVVGRGARIFRGDGDPQGKDLSHLAGALTLGGGESYDVIVDTAAIEPGTYFLYTTNFNHLTNGPQDDYGGLMTEIVITPPGPGFQTATAQ